MDVIVLGLLMLKNCTIYELRKIIEERFSLISSNSMGSIQAAIKKLAAKQMISYKECVENSVNKKIYEITDTGKVYFKDKISEPMRHNEKNMELGKLFFMGFADTCDRKELINCYVQELRNELDRLKQVYTATSPRYVFDEETLKNIAGNSAIGDKSSENIRNIALYQYVTLDFSIAKLEFEIQWFEKFLENQQEANK